MRDYKTILNRKLYDLFPDEVRRSKAVDILASYGEDLYDREPERIRLAILKLSGPNLDKLERNTASARHDYRDVLAWAEYPRQSKHWSIPGNDEKALLVKVDREEYEDWLQS